MPKYVYRALYRHEGATKSDPWTRVVTRHAPTGDFVSALDASTALGRAALHDHTIRGHVKRVLVRKPQYLRVRALAESAKLVGVMEHGGNNAGREVSAIIRENGGTGPEPWCGDFVAHCYRAAGSKVVQRSWAAVRFLGFLTGMLVLSVRKALAGDILVFTFEHTGLLRYWCLDAEGLHRCTADEANYAATREGNTGSSGAVSDSTTGGDGVYDKVRPVTLIARAVRVRR